MLRYIMIRLVLVVLQVFLVATVVFSLLHLLPGDPVLIVLGSESNPSPEVVASVRARLGLDQPLHIQYTRWLQDIVRLDFGESMVNNQPVWDELTKRIPRTFELVLAAIFIAILFGIPLGILAATRRNGFLDWFSTTFSSLGISTPVYVIGTLLVLLLGVELKLLPISGYTDLGKSVSGHYLRLILPAISLSFSPMATITRMTRSSMLEVLNQPYITTARAKGLMEKIVIFRHALRPALIPLLTTIGLQMGSLLGGSVLVETIFNWPGLSTLLVISIGRRDYPMVQGVIMVITSSFVLINLIVDLLYGVVDPRIRRA